MPSYVELCVPKFVLGGHEGRERFTAHGIQRSPRSTKLQIFQQGIFKHLNQLFVYTKKKIPKSIFHRFGFVEQ